MSTQPLEYGDSAPRVAPPVRRVVGRSLAGLRPAVALLALGPVLLWLPNDSAVAGDARMIAALMWVLCWIPAWHYVGLPASRRPPIPFLPLLGVLHAAFYPLQLLIGVDNVLASGVGLDPAVDYRRPIEMATLGWICLMAGAYVMRRRRPPSTALSIDDSLAPRLTPLAFAAMYGGLLFEALAQSGIVPTALASAVIFAVTIAIAAAAFLVMQSARDRLSKPQTTRLIATVAVYVALRLGSGSVAAPLVLLVTLGLARWIGGKRSGLGTVLALVVIMCGAVSVKGILSDYRDQAWFTTEERSLPERTGLVVALLSDRVSRVGVGQTITMGWEAVIGRSATTDLFGDVIKRTPDPVPYWKGRTYVTLIGIAVPRILWPDKPKKTLGQDFGHRYGYLNDFDTYTSINLPVLVEFYANFGEVGVLVGMLLVGIIVRVLERFLNAPGQGQVTSALGLVLLVPLVNIESDFSLIFGGLFLNLVAFTVLLRLAKRYLARTRPNSPVAAAGTST